METQPALFYESFYDALRDLVRNCGGAKAISLQVWPGKSVQDGQTRLLNCLDAHRAEKFGPDELFVLLRIGRRAGFHGAATYLGAECGYTVTPIEPKDEMAELQRSFIDSVHMQARIAQRIESLTQSPIHAVK